MIRSLESVAVPVIVTLLAIFSIRLMSDILYEYEYQEPQWGIRVVILLMALCNMLTVYFAARAWFIFFSAP